MKKRLSSLYIRYSIWLTALTVVVLIMFLGLTVYYVRERAIVDLFSGQQASIANQMSSRFERSVSRCEKSMVMLSRLMSAEGLETEKRQEAVKELFQELEGIVAAVIEIDRDNVIVNGHPDSVLSKLRGRRIDDPAIDHAMKKLNQSYTGEISNIQSIGVVHGTFSKKNIGIGVPLFFPDKRYRGAVLAVLPPQLLLGISVPRDRTYMDDFWLVDESGKIVFHTNKSIAVDDLTNVSSELSTAFKMFSYSPKHYNELMIRKDGVRSRYIIAHAPVRIGISHWWIVLVTPYDKILKPIRSASLNIILGAIGLICVVIITTISIA
ncbi:hypothetical protein EG833_03925, partial [archaeon]|nr:hypothetical protein [archaeon]